MTIAARHGLPRSFEPCGCSWISQPSFPLNEGVSVSALASLTDAELADSRHGENVIVGIASLENAGPGMVSFATSRRKAAALAATRATAVFCSKDMLNAVPEGTAALVSDNPQASFAAAALHLYPEAAQPKAFTVADGHLRQGLRSPPMPNWKKA